MPLTEEEVRDRIQSLAYPLLVEANVDLVELRIGFHKGDVRIQFMADKPQGGITIAECAHLNRAIVSAIEVDGSLGEDFSLEFSSPGLDRPLVTEKDFKRNLNFEMRFFLHEAVGGKKEIVGVLTGIDQGLLTVASRKKRGEITLSLGQIVEGKLVL